MNNFLFKGMLSIGLLAASLCQAQRKEKFNLPQLLKDDKLVIPANQSATLLSGGTVPGISCKGIIWLKGITFSTGSIDVDLRGKDVFQQSFLGIAFHGIDVSTYDAVYFRPFNFQSADSLRKKHMVQYLSEPDFSWDRLRKEHPLLYENGIIHAPTATGWFHAHIVVKENEVTIYVNHSAEPSLRVKKLNTRNTGLIGLWSDSYVLSGDFANLVISPGAP